MHFQNHYEKPSPMQANKTRVNFCSTDISGGSKGGARDAWPPWATLQEHQRIRTNAIVSKDSDFNVLMVVYEIFFYIFQANLRNQ